MQVADICVESLIIPESANKVVEVIASASEPARLIKDLFASI